MMRRVVTGVLVGTCFVALIEGAGKERRTSAHFNPSEGQGPGSGVSVGQADKVYECQTPNEETVILYLIAEPTILRVKDDPTAAVAARMQPIRTPRLLKWIPGWIQLGWRDPDAAPDSPLKCGWLQSKTDIKENPNVLGTDFLRVLTTSRELEKRQWPVDVKAEILRGRPRIGFTQEQVTLALGAPTSKYQRETPTATAEVWTYPGKMLTFVNGKVLQVDTVK